MLKHSRVVGMFKCPQCRELKNTRRGKDENGKETQEFICHSCRLVRRRLYTAPCELGAWEKVEYESLFPSTTEEQTNEGSEKCRDDAKAELS